MDSIPSGVIITCINHKELPQGMAHFTEESTMKVRGEIRLGGETTVLGGTNALFSYS